MNNTSLFLFLAFCLLLYFLPTIVASGRKRATAIAALNLLLGWTFLGWVVALVWALAEDYRPEPHRDHRTPRRNHSDVGRATSIPPCT
jgi:type VI protein secretion system component VasK